MYDKINILGVAIDVLSTPEVLQRFDEYIKSNRPHAIYIVNAHTLNIAWSDSGYRQILNRGDLVLNDGLGVAMAAGLQGRAFKENLVGTDLVPKILDVARRKDYGIFLLGGPPGMAEDSAAFLQKKFPGLRISGAHHGYLDDGEAEANVVQLIKMSSPELLLVGMGNPLQERWIHDHLRAADVPVAIGVGGLFKYFSRSLKRAPAWVRRLRLEWLYLLMKSPGRRWRRYLLGNPQFLWRVLKRATIPKITSK